MPLRESFTEAPKEAMKAGEKGRTSTLRMILAGLKDADIAARPKPPVPDAEILAMLRRMVKSREESVALYRQGKRPDLVDKETPEIKVIEEFLPLYPYRADCAARHESRSLFEPAIHASGYATSGDRGLTMSTEELADAVDKALAETGAAGPKDTGLVMAALKVAWPGRIDLAHAAQLLKARLQP